MEAKTKIASFLTALMILSVPVVYADNGTTVLPDTDKDAMHHDGDWHHGDMEQMMGKILGLSEPQEKQLKDLHKQQKDTMKSTFEQFKANRETFDAEIVKASSDMNKINDLQAQLKTLQGQMVDNDLNSMVAVKKVLTPEQFAGYMALKKERKLMMTHKMHGKFDHKDGWGKDGQHQADKDEYND